MLSDYQIAKSVQLKPITQIAESIGVVDQLETYGRYKAKVNFDTSIYNRKQGKLILVTAINPTRYGEGKTTISIGLADGMKRIGVNVALALREPSLGPVFGLKGGAAGGGYAQIAPMEDINLHFTGDLHAITSANNLLCAAIDNHLFQGNELDIDENNIIFHRCMDMNDRALRGVKVSQGIGVERDDAFDITAASEIMAVLCLSEDATDLKRRLSNIIVAYTKSGEVVTAGDLEVTEAMAILLWDALKPNLVQTLEGAPAFVHGGPFANIAHGCNSVRATKLAMSLSDVVVTEAGFGADLGAEKFMNIKCRTAGLQPSGVVIVATARALKHMGGAEDVNIEDIDSLRLGMVNLEAHIEGMTAFGYKPVVAINRFYQDTDKEIECIKSACARYGVEAVCTTAFAEGGKGAEELARVVMNNLVEPHLPVFTYNDDDTLLVKLDKLARRLGADGVELSPKALKALEDMGDRADRLPICLAKTQYSLSDDMNLLGRPSGFTIKIRDLILKAGAGFVVAVAGSIMLMPGLNKTPNYMKMSIDNDGSIVGLF